MTKGYLALILHAHLPYVKEEKAGSLAEDWLYEAMTESYIPLLKMMERLKQAGVEFRLNMNISPSLAAMLADPVIQVRYARHLDKLLELSAKEIVRNRQNPHFAALAAMYQELFQEAKTYFYKYQGNLLQGFRGFQNEGYLEIITSAATHAYLPLLITEEGIRAQLRTGIKSYLYHFRQKPRGIWLPECGFKPALSPLLAENQLSFFICSSHGILFAKPRPRYGLYAPVYTPDGIAAFGRDIESSKQVWSAEEGYPGDYNYREFYRDIAYELDYEYLKDYLPGGIRKDTGLKYYRITGKTENKEPYQPEKAMEKAAEHASHFLDNRRTQLRYLSQLMDRKPLVVAPYDAELFGHWWFEGPLWLEFLLKKIHYDQDEIKTITLSEYLQEYPENQVAMPAESSWGYQGYHEVWLNESNDWIYRELHQAELKMKKLARKYRGLKKKSPYYSLLNQLERELLLAQSSDWAFIIKSGTMVDYAIQRTKEHLSNFSQLAEKLEKKELAKGEFKTGEEKKAFFPFLDFKDYYQEKRMRKEG